MQDFLAQADSPHVEQANSLRSDFAGVAKESELVALSPAVRFDRFSIACNGLVFDRKNLCQDFGIALDTPLVEVLAIGFIKHGTDLASRLIGQYQFAIYDHMTCELYAAMSPLGFDGFFYTLQNNQLIFSTTMPTLKALVGKPLKPNAQKLAQLLVLDHTTEAQTFYEDVKRLAGGSSLIYKDGKVSVSRFWQPENIEQTIQYRDRRDYYQHAHDIFDIITKEMLEQTGPSVSHLSGGLDSSATSAFLANHLKEQHEKLVCVGTAPTKGFDFPTRKNWNADDTAKMRDLADYNGNIDLHILRSTKEHVLPFDMAKFCQQHSDGPVRNACNIGWGIATHEFARQHGSGYLYVGSGGNMTFSWPGTPTSYYRRARAVAGKCKRAIFPPKKKPFYEEYSAINPAALNQYTVTPPSYTQNKKCTQAEGIVLFSEALAEGAGIINASCAVTDTIQLDPTSDIRLVEFCLQVPNWAYSANGLNRHLVRGMCDGLLPDSIRLSKTRGEQNAEWFYQMQAALPSYQARFKDYCDVDLIKELIDLDGLQKIMTNFESCDPFKQDPTFLISEYRLKMARALHIAEWTLLHFE